jgi:hypothetical protein
MAGTASAGGEAAQDLYTSRPWRWIITVAATTALGGTLGLAKPYLAYDAGITASAATFLLHGRVPYRDFNILYGPAAGWLAALPTALFGPNLLVLRLLGLLAVVGQSVVGFQLVRRSAVPLPAAVVSVTGALVLVVFTMLDLPAWSLALLAATGALLAASCGTPGAQAVAGALAGLAFLFRLDVGGYVLLALLIGTRKLRPALTFAAVVLPFVAWALVSVPISELVRQLVWYPLVGQKRFHDTPLPVLDGDAFDLRGLLETVVYIGAPLVVVLAGLAIWRQRRIRSSLLPLVIFAALCLLQNLSATDMWHAGQALPPALMLVAVWLFPKDRPASVTAGALGIVVAVPLVVLMVHYARSTWNLPDYNRQVEEAARLVRHATAPGEPIFVGEVHHRFAFTNPLLAYYLADRPAGVRDTLFLSGLTNTATIQRRMVDDLERSHTRYLILDERYANTFQASNASRIPGATVLDDYISSRYDIATDLGDVLVVRRHGG